MGVQLRDTSEFHHESGWKEVARIVGILVIGAVAIIAAFTAISALATRKGNDFGEKNVIAKIDANSAHCTPDFPLEISLTNVANADVIQTGFVIIVSDAGHSTVYSSNVIGTDRIIPVDHFYEECYAIPSFYDDRDQLVDIPYLFSSPQYRIVVSGSRLR